MFSWKFCFACRKFSRCKVMNMIIACILDDKFLNVILLHAVLLVVIYEHLRPRA